MIERRVSTRTDACEVASNQPIRTRCIPGPGHVARAPMVPAGEEARARSQRRDARFLGWLVACTVRAPPTAPRPFVPQPFLFDPPSGLRTRHRIPSNLRPTFSFVFKTADDSWHIQNLVSFLHKVIHQSYVLRGHFCASVVRLRPTSYFLSADSVKLFNFGRTVPEHSIVPIVNHRQPTL
jgi:hypothetical protein